jgi:hypothetical protein
MPPKNSITRIYEIISGEMENKCSASLYIEHVAQYDQNTPFQRPRRVFIISYLHAALAGHKLRNLKTSNIAFLKINVAPFSTSKGVAQYDQNTPFHRDVFRHHLISLEYMKSF